MARNIFVIGNPASGIGKTKATLAQVATFLASKGLKFRIFETLPDLRGTQTVAQYLDPSYTDLMIVGGDGTINEVINGMTLDLPVSFIPMGTGNDFVKNINIGHTLVSQLHTAVHGVISRIDLGLCNDRKFINGVGIGFDGQISADMLQHGVPFLSGHVKYYYHVLRILGSYRPRIFDLTIDELQKKQKMILLTVAKGTTFGGGFQLTPHAKLADGNLAICTIGTLSPLMRFLKIHTLQNGTHDRLKAVSLYHARKITIGANPLLEAHIDGEYFNKPPFQISVLPAALQIRTS